MDNWGEPALGRPSRDWNRWIMKTRWGRAYVGLVYDWSNLHTVALPFLLSITTAGGLGLLLRRAAERSGLPRAREVCVRCLYETGLLREGRCEQSCAVNTLPTLPLVLFVASTTFALLAAFFPEIVVSYILPFNDANPAMPGALLSLLLVATAGAALAIVGYFTQDLLAHRETFQQLALGVALVGLILGISVGGTIGRDAQLVAPIALAGLLLGIAMVERAGVGRPVFGLRALAVATFPLFLIALVAFVRILQILAYATQTG